MAGAKHYKLLIWASQGPGALHKGFIIYLYSIGNLKEENVLNSLPQAIKKTVMNTLDIYIEKGRKKGIEEGIEEGIEKGIEKGKEQVVKNLLTAGKFSVAEIAGFTGVTEAFVKKVRAALK